METAKVVVRGGIQERLAAKRTKQRVSYLTSGDIAEKEITERSTACGRKVTGSEPEIQQAGKYREGSPGQNVDGQTARASVS